MISTGIGRALTSLPGQISEQFALHRPGRVAALAETIQNRASNAQGFTLIELLAVILIIGILAAIAIPSFLNQRSKASDASAKQLVSNAQTDAETIGLDSAGSYALISVAKLNSVDPALLIAPSGSNAYLVSAGTAPTGGGTGYTVMAVAPSTGDTYTITRNSNGTFARTCTVASLTNKGGCPLATTTGVSATYTW